MDECIRISEQIRHVVAWVFERGEICDLEATGIVITVTEVRISPDLRNASVFILIRSNDSDLALESTLMILKKAIRSKIG